MSFALTCLALTSFALTCLALTSFALTCLALTSFALTCLPEEIGLESEDFGALLVGAGEVIRDFFETGIGGFLTGVDLNQATQRLLQAVCQTRDLTHLNE